MIWKTIPAEQEVRLKRNGISICKHIPVSAVGTLFMVGLAALFSGCSPSGSLRESGSGNPELSIRTCTDQFPAENGVMNALLGETLVRMGPDSLQKLILELNSEDGERVTRTQYAISSVAAIAAHPGGNPNQKQMIRRVLLKTCDELEEPLQKQFLLDQLYRIAGDATVNFLSGLLSEQELAGPSVRVLTAVGSDKAGKALLHALRDNSAAERTATIQALGTLRYTPAMDILASISADREDPDRIAAWEAYIRIAGGRADDLPAGIGRDQNEGRRLLLLQAQELEAGGRQGDALHIYTDLFKDRTIPRRYRLAAMTGLLRNRPYGEKEIVSMVFSDPDSVIFLAALNFSEKNTESPATSLLMKILKTTPDASKDAFIVMFGRRGDAEAVGLLRDYHTHPSEKIRIAALEAVFRLDREVYLNLLPEYLKRQLSAAESEAVQQQLARLSVSELVALTASHFEQLSPDSKQVLLQACAERPLPGLKELYLRALQSEDAGIGAAAAGALIPLVGDSDTGLLLSLLKKEEDSRQRSRIRELLITIVQRSNNARTILKQYDDLYQTVNLTLKEEIIEIYRQAGGSSALSHLLAAVQSDTDRVHEAAVRALAGWPDDSALNPLLEYIGTTNDLKEQVLCIRGLIRLLQNPDIPDIRAVHYLTSLGEHQLRSEEKMLLISALSSRQTLTSRRILTSYLGDSEVREAALTALSAGSPAEPIPPEGFEVLFNGRNLNGWKGLVKNPPARRTMSEEELDRAQAAADSVMRKHWHIIDGILFFDGRGENICTTGDYRNFELMLDWKIEKGGDSGIYLRGTPQVQIWDPEENPAGSGGLFNNKIHASEPMKPADHATGEWNRFRIIMKGERVTVYLNGERVVDNVIMENYWERDKPIYETGPIELQAHFTPLYFRNIFIRELPDEAGSSDHIQFDPYDLENWQVIGTSGSSWSVRDSILMTEGSGGGWLATKREFEDFHLSLEYRLPEGGNSGVFLRAPLEGDPAYSGMEIQVLDDDAGVYRNLKEWQYTASLYGLQAPLKRATKPAGKWNKMDISCIGPRITVILNGEKVNDINLIDHMRAEQEHPGIKRRKGRIGLQNHSTKVEYRNVVVEEVRSRK